MLRSNTETGIWLAVTRGLYCKWPPATVVYTHLYIVLAAWPRSASCTLRSTFISMGCVSVPSDMVNLSRLLTCVEWQGFGSTESQQHRDTPSFSIVHFTSRNCILNILRLPTVENLVWRIRIWHASVLHNLPICTFYRLRCAIFLFARAADCAAQSVYLRDLQIALHNLPICMICTISWLLRLRNPALVGPIFSIHWFFFDPSNGSQRH